MEGGFGEYKTTMRIYMSKADVGENGINLNTSGSVLICSGVEPIPWGSGG